MLVRYAGTVPRYGTLKNSTEVRYAGPVLFKVEMARITKNAFACCAASANLVRMLHRTASKQTEFTLHHAAPQVKYPLNFQ